MRDTGQIECAQAEGVNYENNSETGDLWQLSSVHVSGRN